MANTKGKAKMDPRDAAALKKYGSFVHGEPYVAGGLVACDAKGNPVKSNAKKAKAKPKK